MSTPFIYRMLLWLLLPVISIATLAVALRDGSLRYLRQRFGRFSDAVSTGRPVWVHCASVGETNTALALIRIWLKDRPDDSFVLTTNTVTSASVLAKQPEAISAKIKHYYLPLDYPLFCRSFLDAINPHCAWIMETEIWLNLLRACHKKNIPVFIVNARLSQRTLSGARIVSDYYRRSLALVEKIFARGEKDAAAFIKLGAETDRVRVVGNLKFAVGAGESDYDSLPDLIATRYILAASTHADEEVQIAQAWQDIAKRGREEIPLLVITPRHPHRANAIEKQLKRHGFSTQRRSLHNKPDRHTSIYIADTIGELPALIRHAELVFMGGSLVAVGGHNVLEPARLGTPQVIGRHTCNFDAEVDALRKVDGIIEVDNAQALTKVFHDAIESVPAHAEIAKNALAFMTEHGNIATAYVDKIESAIKKS